MVEVKQIDKQLLEAMLDKKKFISYKFSRNEIYNYFTRVITTTKRYGKKNISYKETEKIINKMMKIYEDYYYNNVTKRYLVTNFSKAIVIISMISESTNFKPEHYKLIMDKALELCYMQNEKEFNDALLDYCNQVMQDEYTNEKIENYIKKIQELKQLKQSKQMDINKLMKKMKKMLSKGKGYELLEKLQGGFDVGNFDSLGN